MDFQELYEHAGKELAVGMADPRLLERARTHAGNVSALVPQIYCRSRAQSLEEEAGKASSDAHILELKELVAAQEHRMRIRKERYRWIWAIACFAAIIGVVVFPALAVSAHHRGSDSTLGLAILGTASLVLLVVAYIASSYHTNTE